MATLSKRAQILFTPTEYAKLKDEAEKSKLTIGELVRNAVKQTYFKKVDLQKAQAAKRLTNMNLPVDTWEKMEEEIEKGAIE